MPRGKSNPETVAAQRAVEKQQRVQRNQQVIDNEKKGPVFGTGAWAKEHGLWREGDTEGPAPKTS